MLRVKRRILNWVAPDYETLKSEIAELIPYAGFWPKFVDRQVVEQQLKQEFSTDGRQKEICVMFTDVRGFTKLSEKISMRATSSLLNNYYDIIIHHTQDWGGIVDKLIGDGTMSIFGAYAEDDNEEYVLRCIECAKAAAKDFKQMTGQKNQPSLFLGVGINKGPAIVGNFGNGEMVSFTAIGSTVNLAARVEGNAKKGEVLVTKRVAKYLPEESFKSIGKHRFKNVSRPVEVFEVKL